MQQGLGFAFRCIVVLAATSAGLVACAQPPIEASGAKPLASEPAQSAIASTYFDAVGRQVSTVEFLSDGLGLKPSDNFVIRFVIARDGSLRDATIIESSHPSVNGTVLAAVRSAAPFPPPPSNLKGDTVAFRMTFFPARNADRKVTPKN
jgi:TonB family protein